MKVSRRAAPFQIPNYKFHITSLYFCRMKQVTFIILITSLFFACKSKQKEPGEKKSFISVLSLIKQQVAHVDTSLYSIVKIEYIDSSHIDTTYIPREKFREVAADFLSIPDLSDPEVAARYKEDPVQYDEMLNRVIITYRPVDPAKEEIKKQELLVTPASATGDKVNNILVNREINNRDSSLKQDLLWMMDKSFQVITTRQKPGQPEIVIITRVTWNEDVQQ